MTTTIEIPPGRIEAIDRIAAREHVSRDALVQSLIAEFGASSAIARAGESDIDHFLGLWGDRATNGLVHQERLRAEWRSRSTAPTS